MTTKTDEQERADFEAWITASPYEKSIKLNPDSSGFPGQYQAYEVQLAWEAYQAALQSQKSDPSDVMLSGVLRMPYAIAMATEITRLQFYHRAQQALDELEALQSQDQKEWLDTLESKAEALWVAPAKDRYQAMKDLLHHARMIPQSQELQALRDDAARYRWLRDDAGGEGVCVVHIDYWSDEYIGQAHCEVYGGEFLDRAIDAARKEQQP